VASNLWRDLPGRRHVQRVKTPKLIRIKQLDEMLISAQLLLFGAVHRLRRCPAHLMNFTA
jgi:hypothetical protein